MQAWSDGRRNKRKGCQRQVGSLVRFIKGKNVSVEVKRGLTNTILLPTLSYLRGASGMTGREGESNERLYERCDLEPCANENQWTVVE